MRITTAAREVQEREHDEEVDREGAAEDEARRARVHGDKSEDARLVGGEPEHEREQVEPIARAQGGETERGETPHHDDGEQEGEHPLVALKEADDRGPGAARDRGHAIAPAPL
jgi:hypothetical protein